MLHWLFARSNARFAKRKIAILTPFSLPEKERIDLSLLLEIAFNKDVWGKRLILGSPAWWISDQYRRVGCQSQSCWVVSGQWLWHQAQTASVYACSLECARGKIACGYHFCLEKKEQVFEFRLTSFNCFYKVIKGFKHISIFSNAYRLTELRISKSL